MTETSEKTVYQTLKDLGDKIARVSERICDDYCKYSDIPADEHCTNCPLDELYWN